MKIGGVVVENMSTLEISEIKEDGIKIKALNNVSRETIVFSRTYNFILNVYALKKDKLVELLNKIKELSNSYSKIEISEVGMQNDAIWCNTLLEDKISFDFDFSSITVTCNGQTFDFSIKLSYVEA